MSLENLFRLLRVLQVEISEVWPRTISVSWPVTARDIRQAVLEAEARLPKLTTVTDILQTVAADHGVSLEELKSPSRRRDLTDARVQAAVLVRENGHLKLNDLARELNRDPSSLCHAIRRRSL